MTPMEAAVAEAWAGALGLSLSDVRLEDNFFHLGGSSVTAVAMVKRLQTAQSAGSGDWSHHDPRVRYCALFRKPRLLDYAAFLEWVAVAAPTRSAGGKYTTILQLRAVHRPIQTDHCSVLTNCCAYRPADLRGSAR
jgi:hypothetical protein